MEIYLHKPIPSEDPGVEMDLSTLEAVIEINPIVARDGKDGRDGHDAKINGVSTLNIIEGDNIHISQEGSTMTISGEDPYDDTELRERVGDVEREVAAKADSRDVYTIPQVNTLIAGRAGKDSVYTKEETDSKLSGKQETLVSGENIKTINGHSVLGAGNLHIDGTGEENVIESVSVNSVEQPITDKNVNISVPTNLSQLFNDAGFVQRTTDNLANYYLKNQVYNIDEIDQIISGLSGFEAVVVDVLPEASADTLHKIYLVPSSEPQVGNVRDEYITVEQSGSYSWEMIGSTAIDIEGYVTDEELAEALGAYMVDDRIARVTEYLYRFDSPVQDYSYAREYFESRAVPVSGGCSALSEGNLVGGNYDWLDDYEATFAVHTPNAQGNNEVWGNATLKTLTVQKVDAREASEDYKILPFYLTDGINEHGLYAKMNVVPRWGNDVVSPAVSRQDRVCSIMLVRYILDKFSTVDEAVAYIRDYVEIFNPQGMVDLDYELHYMVKDSTKTRIIEFVDGSVKVINADRFTNFHLWGVTFNEDGTVYTPADANDGHYATSQGVEQFGTGLERWNILNGFVGGITGKSDMRAALDAVKFSLAYTLDNNEWFSEFVGGVIDVDTPSTDAAFIARLAEYRQKWEERSKDNPEVWITAHSAIYDVQNREMYVTVQEDSNEFRFGFSGEFASQADLEAEVSRAQQAEEELSGRIDGKVDKVTGKGLSSNDFTTSEKNKLAELSNYDDTAIKARVSTIEGKEAGWDAKADPSDIPSVVDNVTSTSTEDALSAKQGKLLNDRINNIATRGRFLSLWDCTTGMPATNPSGYPYTYQTGDFFIVSRTGETNYVPNGATYTGQPSTTAYSGAIKVNDSIFYDGTNWTVLDTPAGGGEVQDVYQNGESVVSNGVAYVLTPTQLADLAADATHRVVTDVQIAAWNSKIGDAPSDGKQYARKDGAWEEVEASEGGTLYHELGQNTDGPIDQKVVTDELNGKPDYENVAGESSTPLFPVVEYTEQTLTSAQAEQAKKNIKAGSQVVLDTTTTAVNVSMEYGNTYKFMAAGGVASLAFSLVPFTEANADLRKLWTLKFKSGATPTSVTFPTGLWPLNGSLPTIEANAIYELSIDADYCMTVAVFKEVTA